MIYCSDQWRFHSHSLKHLGLDWEYDYNGYCSLLYYETDSNPWGKGIKQTNCRSWEENITYGSGWYFNEMLSSIIAIVIIIITALFHCAKGYRTRHVLDVKGECVDWNWTRSSAITLLICLLHHQHPRHDYCCSSYYRQCNDNRQRQRQLGNHLHCCPCSLRHVANPNPTPTLPTLPTLLNPHNHFHPPRLHLSNSQQRDNLPSI